MLEIIEKYEKQTNANKEVLLQAELPESKFVSEVICNNNSLLIKTLKALFSKEKAECLPSVIIEEIKHLISDIENLFNIIETDPNAVTQIGQILQTMDKLYAYCLQFGLITFGFKGKEETLLIQNMRNKINDAEAAIAELKRKISVSKRKVDEGWRTFEEKLSTREKDSVEKMNAELAQFTKQSDELSRALGEQGITYKNEIEEKKETATSLLNEIAGQRDKGKETSAACATHMSEISTTVNAASEKLKEITTCVSQTNEQLANAQSYATDANTQFKNATQYAADAKAKDDATAQHLANAKQRQDEIDAFYEDIESHKEEMLGFRKESEAAYNKLKADCDETVAKYTQTSEDIVSENQRLQNEIDVLLHKAVSVGLFGVFRQRQSFLAVSRFVMAGLVIASAVGLAIGIYILASDLANIKEVGLNVAFFIRSGIMIPLIYLMYFAAAQYKKERQAEEEYAFKSSISFSLEPYRNLLIKMRKDKELEADFVKKLMEDIFDNPVKRLYKQRDEKNELEDMVDMVKTLAGKLPSEEKKAIYEILHTLISKRLET